MKDEKFAKIGKIVYNFSESGHGKSVADGVGAGVKRTADNIVAGGKDIANFEMFTAAMKNRLKNIFFSTISDEDILKIEKTNPANLKTFAGTMKVHQWVWDRNNLNSITFNELSCYKCLDLKECKHFSLGHWQIINVDNRKSSRNKK